MTTEKSSKSSPSRKPKSTGSNAATSPSQPSADPSPGDGSAPDVSKFQAFQMERLHRSVLVTAPYNPRTITESAKAKLKKNLKAVGLLEPLIWNRTTGTLLGGHQRLACLDALEGKADYWLDIAVVELSAVEEVEQNVALNNPNLQGEYDLDPLADVLKTPGLDLAATGLEFTDLQVMFLDDPDLNTLFQPNAPTEELLSEVDKQAKAAKEEEKRKKTADRREMLKRQGGNSTDDTENLACAVFKTREEREDFMERCGKGRDERYIDGERLVALLDAATPPKPGRSDTKVTSPSAPASKPAPKAKR